MSDIITIRQIQSPDIGHVVVYGGAGKAYRIPKGHFCVIIDARPEGSLLLAESYRHMVEKVKNNSRNGDSSRIKAAKWGGVITGIFGLCGAIIVVFGPLVFDKLVPTQTQAISVSPSATPKAYTLLPPTHTEAPIATLTFTFTPTSTPTPTLTLTDAPVQRIYNFSACINSCDGKNAARTFPAGTRKIYLQWKYDNIPIGAHYVRTWTMEDKGEKKEFVRYDCLWPGPKTGIDDEAELSEPDGLHSGAWEMTISINDQVLLREQIFVEGNWDYWYSVGVIYSCHGLVPDQP